MADQVTSICIQQRAVPVTVYDDEVEAYCECETKIWAKRGTEQQLRSTMVFMSDKKSYMKGAAYNYDKTLEFIVAHSGDVEANCLPK